MIRRLFLIRNREVSIDHTWDILLVDNTVAQWCFKSENARNCLTIQKFQMAHTL